MKKLPNLVDFRLEVETKVPESKVKGLLSGGESFVMSASDLVSTEDHYNQMIQEFNDANHTIDIYDGDNLIGTAPVKFVNENEINPGDIVIRFDEEE